MQRPLVEAIQPGSFVLLCCLACLGMTHKVGSPLVSDECFVSFC